MNASFFIALCFTLSISAMDNLCEDLRKNTKLLESIAGKFREDTSKDFIGIMDAIRGHKKDEIFIYGRVGTVPFITKLINESVDESFGAKQSNSSEGNVQAFKGIIVIVEVPVFRRFIMYRDHFSLGEQYGTFSRSIVFTTEGEYLHHHYIDYNE